MRSLMSVVLLAEIYKDLLPESLALRLFRKESVRQFSTKYPKLKCRDGFLGKGNRLDAKERRLVSAEKIKQAQRIAHGFRWIPWVRFAGVSGSVSFGNASKNDDIDVVIVVSNHRLWLSRLFELLIFSILKARRRYNDRDVNNKICANLFVSCGQLDLSCCMEHDICTALELAVLKPIYKENFYPTFFANNGWIQAFFPAVVLGERKCFEEKRIFLFSTALDGIDTIAMWLQLLYMKLMHHDSGMSFMSAHATHFFPRDQWNTKRAKLKQMLKSYNMN